jgi:transcriptional regulator with XRE-family HTH domain
MEKNVHSADLDVDHALALRLRALRVERGWSLDVLSAHSGISRASLSRLENAEVSATAAVLGRLCAAFGMPMSQLLRQVEARFEPYVPAGREPVWTDPDSGFARRSLSPPGGGLMGEVLECRLPAGADIHYPSSPRAGLEHHLYLQHGQLKLQLEGRDWLLAPGDCLRYTLYGASRFVAGADGASYLLFIVQEGHP